MNYVRLIKIGSVVFAGLFTLFSYAQSAPMDSGSGTVCSTNNYALCSHAVCDCLKPDGSTGPCEEYVEGTDTGWAQCTCPEVKTGQTGEKAAYNANFATLSCDERETPTASGTHFPKFAHQDVPYIYSSYSLGDSLPGNVDGTLDSAELIICDQPDLMALCLDMPCSKDKHGQVTCYCQNVNAQNCATDSWNTLGGNCDQGNCNPGSNKVWSAACIGQTVEGMVMNSVYIREYLEPDFIDFPQYCSVN